MKPRAVNGLSAEAKAKLRGDQKAQIGKARFGESVMGPESLSEVNPEVLDRWRKTWHWRAMYEWDEVPLTHYQDGRPMPRGLVVVTQDRGPHHYATNIVAGECDWR